MEQLWSNMINFYGTGRNVGKTSFACDLIHRLSKTHFVTAIKISPHFHFSPKHKDLIFSDQNILVSKESDCISEKDTCRMLKSGAAQVFFIQCQDKFLKKAFSCLHPYLNENEPIVCESAAIQKILKPALSIKIRSTEISTLKKNTIYKDLTVISDGKKFSYSPDKIRFENKQFKLNAMISLEEALTVVLSVNQMPEIEQVCLEHATNRVLAEDVFSDLNMPPFDKSAMDGYACRKQDLKNELELIELIPAGQSPTKRIGENQCAKIMTGAEVPEGADVVVMIEHIEQISESTIKVMKESFAENICYLGEDVKKGDLVLKKNTLIKPQHIAVLASVGFTNPLVFKQITCGIISTGSELVEPDETPQKAQIRNSNGPQLLAQVLALNFPARDYGIVADNKQKTKERIEEALKDCDLLLLSGGVSVGDFDFVPVILKELNFDIVFNKIAVKPGKHTTFAIGNNKFVIGLPGNPVSSFMQFELVVKPFLHHLTGHSFKPSFSKLYLKENYFRKKTDREAFIPVKINSENLIEPIEYHGSAHINALSYADGIISIPQGVNELNTEQLIYVRQI